MKARVVEARGSVVPPQCVTSQHPVAIGPVHHESNQGLVPALLTCLLALMLVVAATT